jgi:hypothetical protein
MFNDAWWIIVTWHDTSVQLRLIHILIAFDMLTKRSKPSKTLRSQQVLFTWDFRFSRRRVWRCCLLRCDYTAQEPRRQHPHVFYVRLMFAHKFYFGNKGVFPWKYTKLMFNNSQYPLKTRRYAEGSRFESRLGLRLSWHFNFSPESLQLIKEMRTQVSYLLCFLVHRE